MLDYGALPPEINSARMYSGSGSGSMMAAAAAWDILANGLESVSRGYASVISGLLGESWTGSASQAMASAAAPYIAWAASASADAERAAGQARAAAAAYEAAFAATVPPAMVATNRILLANLLATNILGQNAALIGQTESAYEQMWAQDAVTMYTYAASSSVATSLKQFDAPPQTVNAAGESAQLAAMAQAAGSSTAGQSQSTLAQLISAVPQQLQALSGTAGSSSPSLSTSLASLVPSPLLTAFSDFNTFTAPINLGDGISRTLTSAGSFQTGLIRSNLQEAAQAAKGSAGAAGAANAAASSAEVGGPVVASAGSAVTVGKLSAPQSWSLTNPAASSVADAVWLQDAELDGGPSWHEVPATNMWNGVPPTGTGTTSGLYSRPSVSNLLRVGPRRFRMPRPSLGG
ncbi:PPE family protein [Mycobacterium sp.]|uniref:PPE family protein n=1 Tax=Mycobacterium sp. TaxID=1785 RepID=UPI002C952278|nr:PPE family protein [Mycobacterium sp.]HTQ21510.1 PPE family protein [Mycobacterium sp.]